MRSFRRTIVSLAVGACSAVLLLVACGARSGLDLPLRRADAGPKADAHDARPGTDSPFIRDAGEDTDEAGDAGEDVFDAGIDTGVDAADADADAFFPVDVIAPIDVHVAPDSPLACPDGGLPTAYLFDSAGALYTFDPATLHIQLVGIPQCGSGASMPWTLSVSREGDAYLVFQDSWLIFKVELTTLACTETPYRNPQLGINGDFSIAVSRTEGAEKLYVYGVPAGSGMPILADTDFTSFVLNEIAPITPVPPTGNSPLDMQGDPLGHLFGLAADGLLIEIDANTGAVTGQAQTGFSTTTGWAVMSYENQVLLFAGVDTSTTAVARYDIATQTLTTLGTLPILVVGASAIPCLQGG